MTEEVRFGKLCNRLTIYFVGFPQSTSHFFFMTGHFALFLLPKKDRLVYNHHLGLSNHERYGICLDVTFGCYLLLLGYFNSDWIFLLSFLSWQAKLSMEYPPYSATALMSLCASIQSVVYALCTERHWSAWKLGWNVRLLTVVYGVRCFLQISWIYEKDLLR